MDNPASSKRTTGAVWGHRASPHGDSTLQARPAPLARGRQAYKKNLYTCKRYPCRPKQRHNRVPSSRGWVAQLLAKHLLPLFPDHSCYIELFAGGAALFFMRETPAKVEVLNDINGDLTNLYRVLQHHYDEFMRQFAWTLTSRQTFTLLQSTPPETLTDIQRAARFYYLQHTAFGAKTTGQSFGTATTARAWRIAGIAEDLRAARRRLDGVYIENEPWDRCLKRYDRPHSFFYADPPYWQCEGYGRAFGWEQYQLLAEMMGTCKGKMMMSINDHPDIRALFKAFEQTPLQLTYTMSRTKGKAPSGELVIRNYR